VERSIPDESGLQLLGNAGVTALALAAMIAAFGGVSGAHLNPLVTIAAGVRGEIGTSTAIAYVLAQLAGATVGAVVANLLFELPAVTLSTTARTGWAQWLSEVLATFGLVLVVRLTARGGRPAEVALAVGAFVGAAIVFTPSTCFANPAVTLARMLTDTFTGISPASVPAFLAAQVAGATLALAFERFVEQGRVLSGARRG
jgi:glycerol uptake facilitator-like aquaporin